MLALLMPFNKLNLMIKILSTTGLQDFNH